MLKPRLHAVGWSGRNSRGIAQSSGRALGARHQSSVGMIRGVRTEWARGVSNRCCRQLRGGSARPEAGAAGLFQHHVAVSAKAEPSPLTVTAAAPLTPPKMTLTWLPAELTEAVEPVGRVGAAAGAGGKVAEGPVGVPERELG
jgi:hypothetical protein